FVQDPYDMASIVRPYVKWEYMLPSGVVVNEVLRRAHTMMQSDPRGPVYLTLPREILAAEIDDDKVAAFPEAKYGPVKAGGVTPEEADAIAVELMAADNPIAATTYIGRKPEGVATLDALARECGIRVFESFPATLNIPHDSPCFAGFNIGEGIKDADLGLLLDTDVPFIPLDHPQARMLRWIQIDVDPLKENIPVWGFATDRRYQADAATVLRQVLEVVRRRADDRYRQKVTTRIASWAPARDARAKRLAAAAAKTGGRDAMTVEYVAATLNQRLTQDDIVVNEAVRNTGATLSQMPRTKPLTYFAHGGGGLGGSGGIALGVKLAYPDRRVIQVVGDGSFHFMSPAAVYAVSQQCGLPIFTVVLDNRGWQAVKASVQRVYPKGIAAESGKFQARLSSGKPGERRRFDELAHAFGAHGEYVDEPTALGPAIDRCFTALKEKRSAVLTARVTSLADVPVG
ncbi:MAG: thiamine pyrophosphate-dependent enzyme, partial [Stellaceae bacterium]